MKRTLTFLIESHLDQRDYIRFGIEYLTSRYIVQILDCTHFVYPKIPEQLDTTLDSGYQYTFISSSKELSNIDPVGIGGIVIDVLGESISGNLVRRHLLKRGGLRVVLRLGKLHFTSVPLLERLSGLLQKACRPDFIFRLLQQVIMVTKRKFVPVRPIDIIVHGGAASIGISANLEINAHSFDYDRWRSLTISKKANQGRYALFLDEDIVYHPDYARFGIKHGVTEGTYYTAMNRFFDDYQQYTGIPVYIAVHPRSQYLKRPHLWGNRKLLHGEAPEAVSGASHIFIHFSTAISFAILSNKPITHLISNEIMKSFMGRQIIGISQFLNTTLLNIDYELDRNVTLKLNQIDIAQYRVYKNLYIKTDDSVEAPLWEIIADTVDRKMAKTA